MLDLYLIRHAESQSNLNTHIIGGRSNETPLSHLGEFQALWLGQRLKHQDLVFDQMYSSTAVRAQKTAELVCKQLGYPLENILFSEKLLELDQGDWQGQLRDKIYTPETLAEINSDNWNFTPPAGESQRKVEERMYSWVEKNLLAKSKKDLSVGIFTHGLAIKCLLRKILNSDPAMTYKIVLENTSITKVSYSGTGWHLIKVNDAAHLEF